MQETDDDLTPVSLGRWLRGPRVATYSVTAGDSFAYAEDDQGDVAAVPAGRLRTERWTGRWSAGRYVVTEVAITSDDGVQSTDFRSLSVPQVSAMMGMLCVEWVDIDQSHLGPDDYPLDERNIRPPDDIDERGHRATSAHLRYAGQVYEVALATGRPLYKTLANVLGASEVTALNWTNNARKAGFIRSDMGDGETS